MIRDLTVGKVAPPIAGLDLDGRLFSLDEYRNKVVVLTFSAEWCGICRAQAPYERFLLDKYANWPFAILTVQTGSSLDAARQAQTIDPRSHRSWWDAPRPNSPNGPIAGAWNVIGWPATYVLDGDGVIRFVGVRDEDLLRAVRQLVEVQVDRDRASRRK
jgi:thiol-disulfide isomerase/thioredoxin